MVVKANPSTRSSRIRKLLYGILIFLLMVWAWPMTNDIIVRRVSVALSACLDPIDDNVKSEFRLRDLGGNESLFKVTILIASHETTGYRPDWLRSIVKTYTSDDYKGVIDQVIVIWNNPEEPPPVLEGANVLRMKENSLNNRWIAPISLVKTEAVMMLDNDLMVDRAGIACMLRWWNAYPDRLIGPYVRYFGTDGRYNYREMFYTKAEYKVVLPRSMMFHKKFLRLYSEIPQSIKDYVTKTHCDDMVMNCVASSATGKPPLRIQLPKSSIVDYFALCFKSNRAKTGGVSLISGWSRNRGECTYFIQKHFGFPLKTTDEVGECYGLEATSGPQCRVDYQRWGAMFSGATCSDVTSSS
ncbi:hypothetical protein BSKO_05305 [Bryopsis sp. KO-2023]|nr:hypothetical protein BSKO_05305 [Bryopsis sp. KO-2023]